MTQDDLIHLAQKSSFLGKKRQTLIVDNAAWMTPHERDQIAESIVRTGKKMKQNERKVLDQLDQLETAVKEFKTKELPRIMKEAEKSEEQGEQAEAEKLLEKF